MAIDTIEARNGGVLAVGNKDDAFYALQGIGNYDLVVFGAKEVKPPPQAFLDRVAKRGIRIQHLPLLDAHTLTPDERFALGLQIPTIAAVYKKGKRVLITCNLGINRSAFIAALVLDAVHGYGGAQALREVRVRRVRARPLENAYYAHLLEQRPPRPARVGVSL